MARRRIERLVADAGISDPTELDDEQLAEAVDSADRRRARGLPGAGRRDRGARPRAGRAEAPLQGRPDPGASLTGPVLVARVPRSGEPGLHPGPHQRATWPWFCIAAAKRSRSRLAPGFPPREYGRVTDRGKSLSVTHVTQSSAADGSIDPDLPALHAQLVVFAKEIGSLYQAERSRSRELEEALEGIREMYVATMTSLAQVVEAKDTTTRGHLDRTHRYGHGARRARRPRARRAARGRIRVLPARHREGGRARGGAVQARSARRGRVDGDARASRRSGRRSCRRSDSSPAPSRSCRATTSDGTGEAIRRGSAASEIPLAARVFAIADSFDAMTSDRPYRAAMPLEQALEEVRDGAGSQFDPTVVAGVPRPGERGRAPARTDRGHADRSRPV